MARVKRGLMHVKSRRNLLKATKGYRWGRKSKVKLARTAVVKAGANARKSRRLKKRSFRQLWQIQLNAAVREHGLSYSKFIGGLKKVKIDLDRKVLAQIANKHPKIFAEIIKKAK